MAKPTERWQVSNVNSLCEQEGRPERELKSVLAKAFSHLGHVTAAYLARVDYGNASEQHVALCIAIDDTNPENIVEAVSKLFQSMFNSDTHLDILALS
jgi:hypothetical protein